MFVVYANLHMFTRMNTCVCTNRYIFARRQATIVCMYRH